MTRGAENGFCRARLDDLAAVENDHTGGDIVHDAKVVGDEGVRQAHTFLEIEKQRKHLGLNGDVERRCRLVEHDYVRFRGKRPSKGYALPLAPPTGYWDSVS